MVACSTAAAEAPVSADVFVSSIVTTPGLGTLAWIVAVPFFLLLAMELTVILFAGAAVSWEGSAGPVTPASGIRPGLGSEPLRSARAIAPVS